MFTDMYGVKRLKINLHCHTTDSDGAKTPAEAAEIYKNAGYDVLAITDHWRWRDSGELSGLRILAGAEYHVGTDNGIQGVYHILGLGCKTEPVLTQSQQQLPQVLVDAIRAAGGLAVLAHPAWSLNSCEQARALHGIEATEIYNSVSDAHESSRPYSGYFVDLTAGNGLDYALLATDDTHFYDGTDNTKSAIMLACAPDASDEELIQAIREKKFYATQGPEIHLTIEGDEAVVHCSPVSRISFFTDKVIAKGHGNVGDNLTCARTKLNPSETFIRAEVTDANGRMAWSNIIRIK